MTDMTKQTEADRLANQLDYHREYDLGVTHTGIDEQAAAELRRQQAEIERLNEALASVAKEQPAPVSEAHKQQSAEREEPVAYLVDGDLYYPEEIDWETLQEQGHTVAALYTSPQPAQPNPRLALTDEEIQAAFFATKTEVDNGVGNFRDGVRFAEAAHGITKGKHDQ